MKISREEVIKISKLAKLNINKEEEQKFISELEGIISFADMLDEVDTEGIEPTYQVTNLYNVFREDTNVVNHNRERLLANAPQTDGISFIVPKIIE